MSQYEPLYDTFRPRLPDRYVPTMRMSVSPSVYLPGSEVDIYTGELKPDQVRRRRTQAKRLERERLAREEERTRQAYAKEMAKGGVRISLRTGIIVTLLLVLVCGVVLLYQQGRAAFFQREISHLEESITICRNQNAALQMQIAEASDASKICYAAAQKLNMIPSGSVEAIHLVAVDTRPRNTAKANASASMDEIQTTPVPMIASNGY